MVTNRNRWQYVRFQIAKLLVNVLIDLILFTKLNIIISIQQLLMVTLAKTGGIMYGFKYPRSQ